MSDAQNSPESRVESLEKPESKPAKTPLLFKEDSVAGESRFLNISLRGWISLIVIVGYVAACIRAGRDQAPTLLKDVAIMVVTYYFATRTNPQTKT